MYSAAALAYADLARRDRAAATRHRLKSAQAWREEGQLERSAELLVDIDRDRLGPGEQARLDLLLAEIALSRGDTRATLDLLLFEPSVLPAELLPRVLELRARALALSGDTIAAAAERARLSALLPEAERRGNDAELNQLLASVPATDLQALLTRLDRADPLYAHVLRQLRGSSGGSDYAAQTRQAHANVEAGDWTDLPTERFARVCLLLPEAGPLAPAAQAVRDGVYAGWFSAPAESRPELLSIDTGATPDSALAALAIARERGCQALLGPFARDQVTAVFTRGEVREPMLTLNYAEAGSLAPPGALQFALLPEEEAAAAADRLVGQGSRRVAALVSDDEFGARTLAAFKARLEALGGELATTGRYSPAAVENRNALQAALGLADSQARARLLQAITGLELSSQPTRRADLDGLFLVARAPQARLLLPQLRAADIGDWPIVSTSAIWAGTVNPAQDRDLAGVVFAELPWMLGRADPPPARANVAVLPTAQGPAARLFAFGLDAWRLLMHFGWLEANPEQPLRGSTGQLAADRAGNIRRQAVWARFGARGEVESAP
jgi:outer membrane PBP1 activator LpoA protein